MIGPRWFQRLTHPLRWKHLDAMLEIELTALNEIERWRKHAESASGERLYLCNYTAALAEQVADDARLAWCAIHGNRWVEAQEHSARCRRHAEEMESAVRELVPA